MKTNNDNIEENNLPAEELMNGQWLESEETGQLYIVPTPEATCDIYGPGR